MPAPEKGVPEITDPELVKPLIVLFPLFDTQMFPEPSIAIPEGWLNPPAVKLAAAAPRGARRVTLPVRFVTHALPERSIAMADGLDSEPTVYPPDGERAAPVGPNSLTLLEAFPTQISPVASIATPVG